MLYSQQISQIIIGILVEFLSQSYSCLEFHVLPLGMNSSVFVHRSNSNAGNSQYSECFCDSQIKMWGKLLISHFIFFFFNLCIATRVIINAHESIPPGDRPWQSHFNTISSLQLGCKVSNLGPDNVYLVGCTMAQPILFY